jgi:predicted transcriptional regulator
MNEGPTANRLPLHHLRLQEIVRSNPGICLQEIANRMGLSRSATVHHVRRMVRRQLLLVVPQGRRVAHFVADQTLKSNERTLLSLLRQETTRTILDEIQKEPTVAWNELARRLNVGSHSIRWHIARLRRAGLIELAPESDGRSHRVSLLPELARHLRPSPAFDVAGPAPASSLDLGSSSPSPASNR